MLPLAPLPEDDTIAALQRWGLSKADAARAAPLAGGHGLSIAVLGGDASGLDTIPLEPLARDSPQARRLRGMVAAYTTAQETIDRAVLSHVALFPQGATQDDLLWIAAQPGLGGDLTGATRPAMLRGLRRLSERRLIFSSGHHQWRCHPLQAESFRGLLGRTAPPLHDVLASRPAPQPATHGTSESSSAHHKRLLMALLSVGRVSAAHDIYQRTMGSFARMGLREGDWQRGLRLTGALSRHPDSDSLHPAQHPCQEASQQTDMGWIRRHEVWHTSHDDPDLSDPLGDCGRWLLPEDPIGGLEQSGTGQDQGLPLVSSGHGGGAGQAAEERREGCGRQEVTPIHPTSAVLRCRMPGWSVLARSRENSQRLIRQGA